MKLLKGLGIALCFAVLGVLVVPTARADDWNRKTVITFSWPVEVPGAGQHNLPAGTYVFKILDSQSDRHIVQIFNQEETYQSRAHPPPVGLLRNLLAHTFQAIGDFHR